MNGQAGPSGLVPGAAFAEKFRIEYVLGAGAFGRIYGARSIRANAPVVLKIFPAASPDARARFEAEAQANRALSHPNILQLLDGGIADNLPYLVFEWVDGGDLQQELQGGALLPDDAVAAGAAIADALLYAHGRGIIHRDLKPANILLPRAPEATRYRSLKLSDFGVAGALDPKTQTTQAGFTFGTPMYMSPEQVMGRSQTAATDVYALGLVLYEMLTGKRFRPAGNATELLQAILKGQMPAGDWGIRADLAALIRRCVQTDPEERPGMEEVLQTLRGMDHPAAAPSARELVLTAPLASPRPARRSPLWPLAIIVLLAIVAVLTAVTWSVTKGAPHGTAPAIWGMLSGIALAGAGVGAGFWIRGRLNRSSSELKSEALELAIGAKDRVDLTATIAMQVTDLVSRLKQLDERILAGTVALMLNEYQQASEARDRQSALMNVVSLSEKLAQRLSPWYVRYKDVIASAVAVAGAISGLLTAYNGFHIIRKP